MPTILHEGAPWLLFLSLICGTLGEDPPKARPPQCVHCCPVQSVAAPFNLRLPANLSVLQGDKGERGDYDPFGPIGIAGAPGLMGPKGKAGLPGQTGIPGIKPEPGAEAFSVARLSSQEGTTEPRSLAFDSVFANVAGRLDIPSGGYAAPVPGVYHFNVNVHSWNGRETYLHVMRNEDACAALHAQPGQRSMSLSQSLLLPLRTDDKVWLRMSHGDNENGIYGDHSDVYVTFNGHLVHPLPFF
uniref:complement C1q tumor necrosis factor-related protein 6-like n=1 Tax=Myxine glutinosa TaxID=7769 RepID=UPI0035900891